MSHELRTPLNAIIGFSDAIKQQLFGPLGHKRYLEYVNDIYASGSHLLSLINDILDMSKIEAGKYEIRTERLDAAEVVDASVRFVRVRADEAGVALSADAPAGLMVHADLRALKFRGVIELEQATYDDIEMKGVTLRLLLDEQGLRSQPSAVATK